MKKARAAGISVQFGTEFEFYLFKTDENGDSAVENVDLRAALDTLSTEENRMLYLKFWEGLTVREIAKAVGLPKSTVHGLIKGALKKVGKILDE